VFELADVHAELLRGLTADGGDRIVLVEQTGGRLDEPPVGVAVDVDRVAELPRQQHGAPLDVVQQDRGPVAAVVGLALLAGPVAVDVPVVEGRAAQDVPAGGQELHVAHDDVGIAGQVLSGPVQTGAATGVRYVEARAVPGRASRRGHEAPPVARSLRTTSAQPGTSCSRQ
jgi:hypothetical protein